MGMASVAVLGHPWMKSWGRTWGPLGAIFSGRFGLSLGESLGVSLGSRNCGGPGFNLGGILKYRLWVGLGDILGYSHKNIPGSSRWDRLGDNHGGSLRDSLGGRFG